MIWMLASVFAASFLGSLHCVGMCGGIVAFLSGGNSTKELKRISLAYHGGRLLSYALLGALAGMLGQAIDLGGDSLGIGRLAMALAGGIMLAYGVLILLRQRGKSIPLPVPRVLQKTYSWSFGQVQNLHPNLRGVSLGLLTAFLPCGWLYLFAASAAATGDWMHGALTMVAFWAGSVPALAALGLGVQKVSGPLQKHLPTVTASLLMAVGLLAVLGRLDVPSFASSMGAKQAEPACCAPVD